MGYLAAAFAFLYIIAAVLGADDVEYVNSCFFEDASGSCASKTVEIGGKLYGCANVIDFENEITKIEFKEDRYNNQYVLVQDSIPKSYTVDETKSTKKESNLKNTDSCTHVVDQNKNAYTILNGEASVTGPKGARTRNITTETDFIPTELALDPVTGKLVILAVRKGRLGATREGSLFGINVNSVNTATRDSIQAEKISPRNVVITGLSIYEGLEELLIGIQSGGQFKYVKLSAVPEDHRCSKTNNPKTLEEQILQILQESNARDTERISKLCAEYNPTSSKRSLSEYLQSEETSAGLSRNLPDDENEESLSNKLYDIEEEKKECDNKLQRHRKMLQKVTVEVASVVKATAKEVIQTTPSRGEYDYPGIEEGQYLPPQTTKRPGIKTTTDISQTEVNIEKLRELFDEVTALLDE